MWKRCEHCFDQGTGSTTPTAFAVLTNVFLYSKRRSSPISSSHLGGWNRFLKVVEENALYWVQTSQQSTTGYKIGYSDGTAAGTRVIEDAPSALVQALDNAVAIQTVGVAPL